MRTSRNGNAGVMEVLIAAGASIKGAQYVRARPCARRAAASAASATNLLSQSLLPLAQADQTPLHYTAYFCNPECVSLLLKANADVEKRDSVRGRGRVALRCVACTC